MELPNVDAAYLRSDNAGCYHCSKMIATIPHISATSGIKIKRWDYSEPQSGKGPCDRAAAWIKRKVWDRVAENHPAQTAEQFVNAASSYGGIPGVSTILGNVPQSAEQQQQFTIPDISKYFNFEFSEDHITVWQAYNVGSGLKIPLSVVEGKHLQSSFITTKAYHGGELEHVFPHNTDKYWKSLPVSPERTANTHQEQAAPVEVDITQESADTDSDAVWVNKSP